MSEDFDAERLTGIGGSDAASALGISPWRTPYALYLEKIGEPQPAIENELMVWGKLLEPVIREEYTRRTGRDVEMLPMLRHPTHRHMIVHLDGLADRQSRVLEIKTTRTAQGWGEPGSDEVPQHYLAQVHHGMVVAGAAIADLVVLIGGSDFRIYEIKADAEIARYLVAREAELWHRIENREPPDPITLPDAVKRWGRLAAAGTVFASEADCVAVDRLHQIRAARKALDSEADELQLTLLSTLGETGDQLMDNSGNLLATWKLDNGHKGYTVKARAPQRRFLLKEAKNG